MHLSPPEVERFYSIWNPLMLFVNERLNLVPGLKPVEVGGPWNPRQILTLRDAMWITDTLREEFIAENPAGLSGQNLALAESWQHRVQGNFYILRDLKHHSIFLRDKPSEVYGVVGISNSLAEVLPFLPYYTKAVLLPFEGRIIYDSLLAGYNITFGKGIRSSLEQSYKDARERGAIITSLLPSAAPASPEEQQETAASTNAKVLDAFQKRLLMRGLSLKVSERDRATVTDFAEGHLLAQSPPLSLREFGPADVKSYLSALQSSNLKESQLRQIVLSLKRFTRFLLDTDRMDWETAEYIQEILKGED